MQLDLHWVNWSERFKWHVLLLKQSKTSDKQGGAALSLFPLSLSHCMCVCMCVCGGAGGVLSLASSARCAQQLQLSASVYTVGAILLSEWLIDPQSQVVMRDDLEGNRWGCVSFSVPPRAAVQQLYELKTQALLPGSGTPSSHWGLYHLGDVFGRGDRKGVNFTTGLREEKSESSLNLERLLHPLPSFPDLWSYPFPVVYPPHGEIKKKGIQMLTCLMDTYVAEEKKTTLQASQSILTHGKATVPLHTNTQRQLNTHGAHTNEIQSERVHKWSGLFQAMAQSAERRQSSHATSHS